MPQLEPTNYINTIKGIIIGISIIIYIYGVYIIPRGIERRRVKV